MLRGHGSDAIAALVPRQASCRGVRRRYDARESDYIGTSSSVGERRLLLVPVARPCQLVGLVHGGLTRRNGDEARKMGAGAAYSQL